MAAGVVDLGGGSVAGKGTLLSGSGLNTSVYFFSYMGV